MKGLDVSPFEINLLRRPSLPIPTDRVDDRTLTPLERTELQTLMSHATAIGLLVRHRLEKRQDAQAVQYDRSKRTQRFETGEKVLLDRDGISTAFLKKPAKLTQAFLGPFTVKNVEPHGHPDTYELDLPTQLQGLHPVFHTRLLRKWAEPKSTPYRTVEEPPEPLEIDGEQEWFVERILAQRIHRKKLQYYVKWTGYPVEDCEWIDATALDECAAVDDWIRSHPPSSHQTRPSTRKRQRRTR